jgi:hypothetical protein
MFAIFIDWLCGSNGGYGFDPVTHDYSPITYVVAFIIGLPISILVAISRANAMYEALRAPFVRVVRGGPDPFDDSFGSYAHRNEPRGS